MTISDGDRGSRSYMGVGNDGRGMTLGVYLLSGILSCRRNELCASG
jgi:hypothetical protein